MFDIFDTITRVERYLKYGKAGLDEDYERRKIGRIDPLKNNGYGVSTCEITDIPGWEFETAVLDANNAYPVERYHNIEDAIEGHKKWVEKVKWMENGTEIIRIGDGDMVEDEKIVLEKVEE